MMAMALGNDEAPERDDEERAPLLQRPLVLLLLGALAVAVVFVSGWVALAATQRHAVARIQIEGRFARLQIADVEAAVRPLADRSFGDLDLLGIRAAVEALPWTASASVERVWPGTLRVRVTERKPLARWNEAALLDSEARAFTPLDEELPAALPLLAGPPGSEIAVSAMYASLAGRLRGTVFALQGLAQDARGEWTASTAAGVDLRFGRDDPQTKLDVLLGPAERVLQNRMSEVKDVDLRYTNGFSVGWRELAPAQKGGG